jgi:hypothetical protein
MDLQERLDAITSECIQRQGRGAGNSSSSSCVTPAVSWEPGHADYFSVCESVLKLAQGACELCSSPHDTDTCDISAAGTLPVAVVQGQN